MVRITTGQPLQMHCVLRRLLPKRFLSFACSSTISASDEGGKQEPDVEALRPSQEFVKSLPPKDASRINDLMKELEVYIYMGTYTPNAIKDQTWKQLLSIESLADRVGFLDALALKQRREEYDLAKQEKRRQAHEAYKIFLDSEMVRYERGEMAYGPNMCQLIVNPLRNKRRVQQIEGSRVWASMRIKETPKIAIDMQYIFKSETFKARNDLANQIQYSISENFERKKPLPFHLINLPDSQDARDFLLKAVGFYSSQYQFQTILPDFSHKNLKENFPNENIFYISRTARNFLDGPLEDGVYTLCASFDYARESLGASRKEKVRAVRLPLHKYVQWKSGPQHLPLPNIIRILDEVWHSGGDWHKALHNNISYRHLRDPDENKKVFTTIRKEKRQRRDELVRTIAEATGQQV